MPAGMNRAAECVAGIVLVHAILAWSAADTEKSAFAAGTRR